MKTTFLEDAKADVVKKRIYGLNDLKNKNEMIALIEEVESILKPCAHCGRPNPVIWYYYDAERTKNYHRFFVRCCAQNPVDGRYLSGCQIQTMEWGAEDDDKNEDIEGEIHPMKYEFCIHYPANEKIQLYPPSVKERTLLQRFVCDADGVTQ